MAKIKLEFQPRMPEIEAVPAGSSSEPAPLWKSCDDRTLFERVQINEDAAEHSKVYFKAAEQVLKEFSTVIPACLDRIHEIKAIQENKKRGRFLIGFLGPSGSGKSSLINALLRQNILPRSEESASTAVPVEISWNELKAPNQAYRAIVEGISISDFTKELKVLFKDLDSWNSDPDGEDDLPDVETYQRMNQTLSKLKIINPEWKSLDDIKHMSIKDILDLPQVEGILSKIQFLTREGLEDFAEDIKGYIEASKPRSGSNRSSALWPLVKVVRLYIKSDILEHGITLVDLPGTQDSNSPRDAVAENYRKNLNMACVTVRAVRAATDKGGQELLSAPVQLNMQFDGLVTSQSLCYIITQCDVLEDWAKYVKDHPNLRSLLEADMDLIISIIEQLPHIRKQKEKQEKVKGEEDTNLQNLLREEKRLTSQVNKIMAGLKSTGQKRKRQVGEDDNFELSSLSEEQRAKIKKLEDARAQIPMIQAKVNEEGNNLSLLQTEESKLSNEKLHALCRVKRACIENRAMLQSTVIQEDYAAQRKMMGKEDLEEPLKVISVSAGVFSHLLEGEKDYAQDRGFSTKRDTHIPELREALLATTLVIREANAKSFNNDAEMSLGHLKSWSDDTAVEYKMNREKRAILNGRFEEEYDKFYENVCATHKFITNDLTILFETGFYSKLPDASEKAASRAKRKIEEWAQLKWPTHRATNKGEGFWIDSSYKPHNWNEDLVGLFKPLLLKDWVTIQDQLPKLKAKYEKLIERNIIQFIDGVVSVSQSDDIHAAVHDAVKLSRQNMLRKALVLRNRSSVIFGKIESACRVAHRLILDEVGSSWADTFALCGDEKGKGLFQRNKARHRETITNDGLAMYQRAGDALKTDLTKICKKLPYMFDSNYKVAVELVKRELKVTLERHTANGDRVTKRRVKSLEKEKLKDRLQPIFEELEKAWRDEPKPLKNGDDEVSDSEHQYPDDGDSEDEDFKDEDSEEDDDDDMRLKELLH